MVGITNTYIKLKEKINQNDYWEISNLQKLCLEAEPITLKLEIDYKLSLPKGDKINSHIINEFMYYDENRLIGYIGICQFGGDTLEVSGMVHPDYRRIGVFTRLFALVTEEWNRRKSNNMLLLCDRNSISGHEFIKSTNACLEHSEYEMYLTKGAYRNLDVKNVILRKATNNDAKEIAFQDSIYFGMELNEEKILMPEDMEKLGSTTYIAEINNKIIGKVRIETIDGIGGIYGLGVLPDYRGKGYGREVLYGAVEKLKERNPREIMLQVVTVNKKALNLYKSCGFEETSIMDYFELKK